jgi:hypothetical protein
MTTRQLQCSWALGTEEALIVDLNVSATSKTNAPSCNQYEAELAADALSLSSSFRFSRVEARALFGGNCARESSNLTRFRTHDRRYKHSPGVVTADAMVGCNVPHGECNIDRVDCDGVQQWVR